MLDLFSDPKYTNWLHELTLLGYKENITVSSDHAPVIELFFKEEKTAEEALSAYKKFLTRWNALTMGRKPKPEVHTNYRLAWLEYKKTEDYKRISEAMKIGGFRQPYLDNFLMGVFEAGWHATGTKIVIIEQ